MALLLLPQAGNTVENRWRHPGIPESLQEGQRRDPADSVTGFFQRLLWGEHLRLEAELGFISAVVVWHPLPSMISGLSFLEGFGNACTLLPLLGQPVPR